MADGDKIIIIIHIIEIIIIIMIIIIRGSMAKSLSIIKSYMIIGKFSFSSSSSSKMRRKRRRMRMKRIKRPILRKDSFQEQTLIFEYKNIGLYFVVYNNV